MSGSQDTEKNWNCLQRPTWQQKTWPLPASPSSPAATPWPAHQASAALDSGKCSKYTREWERARRRWEQVGFIVCISHSQGFIRCFSLPKRFSSIVSCTWLLILLTCALEKVVKSLWAFVSSYKMMIMMRPTYHETFVRIITVVVIIQGLVHLTHTQRNLHW